ncbi:MAG: riboflavin synthase [Nitrososphaerales archaeon]
MFTGLIQAVAPLVSTDVKNGNLRLGLELPDNISKVQVGDSISINGVCLTVSDLRDRMIWVDVVKETQDNTNLAEAKVGDPLNLEASMKLGDGLGGHIMTGHIDGTGIITKIRNETNSRTIWVSVSADLAKMIVKKGSVGLEGVSLTVVDLKDDTLSVAIIPHTRKFTNLGSKSEGNKLNVEADLIGKHVLKSVQEILGNSKDPNRKPSAPHPYEE